MLRPASRSWLSLFDSAALRTALCVFLALLALVSWLGFVLEVLVPVTTSEWEFIWPTSGGWVASHAALEGRADLFYSPQLALESARLGAFGDPFQPNAPTTALFYLPIARLPVDAAFAIWTWGGFAAFMLGWLLVLRAIHAPLIPALGASALLPFFAPLKHAFAWGQVYPILFALLALGAWALSTSRPSSPSARLLGLFPALGGIALGLASVLRLYYGLWMLLPLPLLRRRLAFAVGLVSLGLAVLATALFWGFDLWATWLGAITSWRDRPETSATAYQSLSSFFNSLFRPDPTFNPQPLAPLPWLSPVLWYAAVLALPLISLHAAMRASRPPATYPVMGLSVLLSLLLAPINEQPHFVLALFPLVVVAATLRELGASTPTWLLLLASATLLGAPLPYNSYDVAGWETLLHYPRLYGTIVLWALNLRLLYRLPSSSPPPAAQPA